MKYIVTGVRTQEISVEVEAANEQEAIDKADMMPRNAIEVWDTTKLWTGAEIDESW